MSLAQLPLSIVIRETQRLRTQAPLIHCLTNEVVQNITANALLAIGASPAMVVAQQEVEQFTTIADNVLINVGTLYQERAEAMLLAAKTAQITGKNWVLDPVAIGALTYRTEFVRQLLTYQPKVIRGNASEILALAGLQTNGKGADSTDSSTQALDAAKMIANQYQTIVAVTGDIDYITDGQSTYSMPYGHEMMTKVTGCGCALSAIVAAFTANCDRVLDATASACAVVALAGQQAEALSHGPGSFVPHFIDHLYHSPENVIQGQSL